MIWPSVHHLISLKACWEVQKAQCAPTKVNALDKPHCLIIKARLIQRMVNWSMDPFMSLHLLHSSRIFAHWSVITQLPKYNLDI